MNKAPLTVVIEEKIDSVVVDEVRDALSIYEDEAHIELVGDRGPQASILLLGITSVLVIFSGTFFGS